MLVIWISADDCLACAHADCWARGKKSSGGERSGRVSFRAVHIILALLCGEEKRQNAWRVKYWEIIIENLRNAGWNCGCISIRITRADNFGLWPQSASDAGRFIVNADQELPAFLELESAIQTDRHNHQCDCPEPDEELGNYR